jgi:hypothetical protein
MNEHLSDQQIARIEALGASRSVLIGGPSFGEALVGNRTSGASLVDNVGQLIEVAHYILTGDSFVRLGQLTMPGILSTEPGYHLEREGDHIVAVPDEPDVSDEPDPEDTADDGFADQE